MKIRPRMLLGIMLLALALLGLAAILLALSPGRSSQQIVDAARQTLRAQGFPTDLADFHLATGPEFRDREAALMESAGPVGPESARLMQTRFLTPVGPDTALVLWQQPAPRLESDDLLWPALQEVMAAESQSLDDAAAAALSGPIRFNLDSRGGPAIRLPHLAVVKRLTQQFSNRMLLDLHTGDRPAAWTNLLAATRLITAWEPEPAEISHLARFTCENIVFEATWQALQNGDWSADQLTRLQAEWEGVDFFKPLPETAAFRGVSDAATCEWERQRPPPVGLTLTELRQDAMRSPASAWREVNRIWDDHRYRQYGSYVVEADLLNYGRAREVELRQAILATNWLQMQAFPGVTNVPEFISRFTSRTTTMMRLRRTTQRFSSQGISLLGHAAEAENRRRLLITAIALERYRLRHGDYPAELAALAPGFLKTVPADFTDSQPLRYRPTADGHFLLYALGLDGTDHGGVLATGPQPPRFLPGIGLVPAPTTDLVWPRPASAGQMAQAEQQERDARATLLNELADAQAAGQWDYSARRQAGVEKLLAAPPAPIPNPPLPSGRSRAATLANPPAAGTNPPALADLLALHPLPAGPKPETVTFKIPLAYDVITNLGDLLLCVDPVDDNSEEGSLAIQAELTRAPDGDCLLAWNTIFECPGRHALQLVLEINSLPPGRQEIAGPLLPFTVTNLCEFSFASAHFDPEAGAVLHAKLSEPRGDYVIDLITTNGTRLKTITGSTTNGILKTHWDLIDDQGRRCTDESFDSVFHLTLPASGRTQTLHGP